MKKKIMLLIALALLLQFSCFGVCTQAVTTQSEGHPLLKLLTESQDAGGLVPSPDSTRLPNKMPSVESKPVLAAFHNVGWEYAAMDNLEDAIQQAVKDVGVDYIILEEYPVCLYDNRNDKPYSAIAMDPVPTYITDIMNASTEQSFCGTIHTIQNVLYFNDDSVNQDAIVYYITSGGTFVRYYENWQSTPVEYTLEEFQSKAKAYCAFLEYHIANRNKDGDILVGPLPGFFYFIEDPEGAYENSRYRHIPWTERYPWALPGIICVTLVTFTPLAFLLAHKIIKKRTPRNK